MWTWKSADTFHCHIHNQVYQQLLCSTIVIWDMYSNELLFHRRISTLFVCSQIPSSLSAKFYPENTSSTTVEHLPIYLINSPSLRQASTMTWHKLFASFFSKPYIFLRVWQLRFLKLWPYGGTEICISLLLKLLFLLISATTLKLNHVKCSW